MKRKVSDHHFANDLKMVAQCIKNGLQYSIDILHGYIVDSKRSSFKILPAEKRSYWHGGLGRCINMRKGCPTAVIREFMGRVYTLWVYWTQRSGRRQTEQTMWEGRNTNTSKAPVLRGPHLHLSGCNLSLPSPTPLA